MIPHQEEVVVNEAIPMAMMRVANMERAQLLVEATSRVALQLALKEWVPILKSWKTRVRWHIEVDPMTI